LSNARKNKCIKKSENLKSTLTTPTMVSRMALTRDNRQHYTITQVERG